MNEYMSWYKFDKACSKIVKIINRNFTNIKSIYGIPKGGLVLAIKLCNTMKLPLVIDKNDIGINTLIVDDVADTGNTLSNFKYNTNAIVTLYYHKNSKVIPDIWLYEKKDKYIIFPWEKP